MRKNYVWIVVVGMLFTSAPAFTDDSLNVVSRDQDAMVPKKLGQLRLPSEYTSGAQDCNRTLASYQSSPAVLAVSRAAKRAIQSK